MARVNRFDGASVVQVLAWRLRHWSRTIDRHWGLAGVALCVSLLLVVFAYVADASQQRRLAQAEVLRAGRDRQPPVLVHSPILGLRAKLASFQQSLPAHDEIPHVVKDLFALADSMGLQLSRGDYHPQTEPGAGFIRYRMALPVMGEAKTVQRFVVAALKAHPALALDKVSFKREKADTNVIEARLSWVLFAREPEPMVSEERR